MASSRRGQSVSTPDANLWTLREPRELTSTVAVLCDEGYASSLAVRDLHR